MYLFGIEVNLLLNFYPFYVHPLRNGTTSKLLLHSANVRWPPDIYLAEPGLCVSRLFPFLAAPVCCQRRLC